MNYVVILASDIKQGHGICRHCSNRRGYSKTAIIWLNYISNSIYHSENGLEFKIPNIGKNLENTNSFFDNLGLKTISDYALTKYKSEPNDESLTKFYTLGFDDNYNIVPKM